MHSYKTNTTTRDFLTARQRKQSSQAVAADPQGKQRSLYKVYTQKI